MEKLVARPGWPRICSPLTCGTGTEPEGWQSVKTNSSCPASLGAKGPGLFQLTDWDRPMPIDQSPRRKMPTVFFIQSTMASRLPRVRVVDLLVAIVAEEEPGCPIASPDPVSPSPLVLQEC